MKLEIVTPDKRLFDGEASAITAPGLDGRFGILDNHAPMIASLKSGKVKVTLPSGEISSFDIAGGVAEVLHNKVIILAE